MIPKPIKLSEADIARFWSKVDCAGPDDCWEWTEGRDTGGYGVFCDCVYSKHRAHRVAYVITNGDTELEVLHWCNHPWCCNPNHLYAGTQKRNMQQCVADGRLADNWRGIDNRGERCGSAKLTESDVREICRRYANGELQREIAEGYGISQVQVSRICRGASWKHIWFDSNERETCDGYVE